MKATAIALAVTLGAAAGAANASVSDINRSFTGSPSAGYVATLDKKVKTKSFSDFFTFSLPVGSGTSGGTSVIAGFNSKNLSNVKISEFELEDVTGLSNRKIAADRDTLNLVETNPKSGSFSFSGLNAGHTYALEVVGSLSSCNTGIDSYAGSITISPVPEPSEYALMASGLGLFGFIASRRNKKVA